MKSACWSVPLAIALSCIGKAAEPRPRPLPPEQELASFRFADTILTAELVAAEPDVISPVAIAWDEDGRMFVAEMNDYPLEPAGGRVRLLQPNPRDGGKLRATVFADRLPFPTSVLPWRGGLLVTAAPNIWYLKDNNGDGQVDERQIVFTGFGEGNQQLRVNGLSWGLDNWVYGANGRSDGEIRKPDQPPNQAVSLRGHDFRFRPETGEFETLAGRSQFGTTFNDWGDRFLSWNTVPIRQVVIEERYLNRNPYLAPTESFEDLLPLNDTKEVFPATPPPLVFNEESSTHFNALAGLTIYRGELLGQDPSGRAYHGNAFVGESLRNLVHRRILAPRGSTFTAQRGEPGTEFLVSTDPWFHPVNFTTGPDGALYIVDFYRRFVEHPHYVHDQSVVAKVPWRDGAGHGRIWRVRRRDSSPGAITTSMQPRLGASRSSDLVQHLTGTNAWWSDTAQRLLVDRQDESVVPLLRIEARTNQNALSRMRVLWTLDGLRALDAATLLAALRSEQAPVRETAVRLAQGRIGSDSDLQQAVFDLASDANPRVRLQVALGLGELQADKALAAEKMAAFARLARIDLLERWQSRAILSSIESEAWPLFQSLVAQDRRWLLAPVGESAYFLRKLGELVGAKPPGPGLAEVFGWFRQPAQPPVAGELILFAGIADGLRRRNLTLGTEGNGPSMGPLVHAALETARVHSTPLELRLATIRLLESANPGTVDEVLMGLMALEEPIEIQETAARAVANLCDETLARRVFDKWSAYPRYSRQALVTASLSCPTMAEVLLQSVEQRTISILEVDASSRRAFMNASTPALRERARNTFGALDATDRRAVVQSFEPALTLEGRTDRGAGLFAKTCLICHQIKGHGNQVGPDLSAVGTRPKRALLEDILDPSQTVSPDFVSYTIQTTDGETVTGLLVSETPAQVTVRRAQQADDSVPRSRIKEVRAEGKSLMPEGLEQGWTVQDFADLLAFLQHPDVSSLPSR